MQMFIAEAMAYLCTFVEYDDDVPRDAIKTWNLLLETEQWEWEPVLSEYPPSLLYPFPALSSAATASPAWGLVGKRWLGLTSRLSKSRSIHQVPLVVGGCT